MSTLSINLTLPAIGLFAVLMAGSACDSPDKLKPKDAESIEAMLQAYLPLLGEAYATGDVMVLEGYVAEKEMVVLHNRISDLLGESRVMVPTFKSFTLESAQVWSYANAFATTMEVWDLQVYVAGTDTVLSESMGQRNRVKYQLKRVDGSWQVYFRQLETTFD